MSGRGTPRLGPGTRAYDDPVDLSEYDIAYTKEGV